MTIRTSFLSILLFSFAITFGQRISELKIDNKQSILNDKVYFQFPSDAKNISRQADIMSADPNTNKETRIILDIDKQRLVFFARELYVTSDKTLVNTLSKDNGENAKTRILDEKDSLLSVLVTPTKFDSTKNAILVNNLYVRTQDNSVFVIGAYINPDAYKNKDEFQKLSEKVFLTLSKGSRKLNFKARTEVLPIFDGKKKFRIALPDGYIITKDKKYDFEVLKFQKIKDLADTNWSSLTIYTGNHPSYFYGEHNFDESNAEKVKGQFLTKNVEWLYFKTTEKQFYLKEQKIPSDQIVKGLIVHIAMSGSNEAAIDELTKLVGNIKLTE